ncbi:MFS general substrate transporter [Piedraia hortae CBS 480.64]|uniref:MFS general substrate transporter n=1 Tax=Piedraia hortae CBS 480.64 TaxID=1314780 RepID=A0A6A7BWU9_9PEZI|nr:MFS general substrate transporter [Piedraia hortae CBS 480.64]
MDLTPTPSPARRALQVTLAVIYCLLSAGTVFGFAALKPVFVSEGIYHELCTPDEVRKGVWVCHAQDLRLNLMFTVAAVSTNICALPVGSVLDRFGPRISSCIGAALLALGALCLATADKAPVDGVLLGFWLLALGGPFVFIASFQLSNTFPDRTGLILALLTGAFDASSSVFLVYRLVYQHTDGGFTPSRFFLVYLAVPAFILIAQLTVMPKKSYKLVAERGGGMAAKPAALKGRTAVQQILTPWFALITLFTVVQMMRINYFVATIRMQYTYMLASPEQAARLNGFFDVALPLGGVFSIPLIGLVLDRTSMPFILGLMTTLATLIGGLGIIPQVWASYANITLFVVFRPFFYTVVSDYAAKVFGFKTFGTVYGLIIAIAGICNLGQAGLDKVTHEVFRNNPLPVNVALMVVGFTIGTALTLYSWRTRNEAARELLEEEAEEARETLIPSEGRGYGTA